MSITRGTCLLVCCLFAATTSAFAQAISVSEVQGTVLDMTGGALPGVDVKITQADTGLVRRTVSGPDGGFRLLALPPGSYKLEASLQGFKNYVQEGIVLQVSVNPTISITMQVGAVTDLVTVTASTPLVETQSTAVGQVIDQRRIVEVPLNTRDVTQLVLLTGAAVEGRTTRGNYGSGGTGAYGATAFPSLAGGITGSVAFSLDGGTHNDPLNNGNLPLPFPDALQEFKVETSALDAQFGYHSAGVVNAVTKSGTNVVRGSAFEFTRDSTFNAQRAFTTVVENSNRNQFGGTMGGPVVKNRLFYFGAYQGTVQRQIDSFTTQVPTPAMLQGDFSTFASAACRTTGAITLSPAFGFVNNRLDASQLNPVAVNFARTNLPIGLADQCGNVWYSGHSPGNNPTEHQIVARTDFNMTARQTLFVRVYNTHLSLPTGDPGENPLFLPQTGQKNNVFSSVLGHTFIINPRMVSQFRATYNYNVQDLVTPSYFNWNSLGISNINQADSPKYISGLTTGTGSFGFSTNVSRQPYQTIQLAEDMSTTLKGGAHQINYGGNWIYLKALAVNELNRNGSFSFTGVRTGSNIGLVDLLLGLPATFTQAAPVPSYQRENVLGLYVQDIWRANRKLTVNLGIRWDPMFGHQAPGDDTAYYFSEDALRRGIRSTIYPNAPAGLLFPGDPGGPTTNQYFPNVWPVFSPRIGVAWDPNGDGKLAVRASYGLQHEIPSFAFDQFGFSPPIGISIIRQQPDFPAFDDPWRGYPGGNPYPGAFAPGHSAIWLPSTQILSYGPDVKVPYVQQWNVSLEKQVASWLLSATYLGNKSVHLWNDFNANATVPLSIGTTIGNSTVIQRLRLVNPDFGTFYGATGVLDDNSTGQYNGVVLSVRGRVGRVFDATANFTYSHCVSDPYSLALGLVALDQSNPYDRSFDRGNCVGQRDKIFNFTALAAVPQLDGGVKQAVLGNWRGTLSGRIMSGTWFNATSANQALTGTTTQRPTLVAGANPYADSPNEDQWLNPAAFALPALGTYGNEPVNDLLGPKNIQLDLAVSRVFGAGGGRQIEIRVESFNFLNLTNLANPVASITNANFGKIHVGATGTAAGTLGQPRTMQFALRYLF